MGLPSGGQWRSTRRFPRACGPAASRKGPRRRDPEKPTCAGSGLESACKSRRRRRRLLRTSPRSSGTRGPRGQSRLAGHSQCRDRHRRWRRFERDDHSPVVRRAAGPSAHSRRSRIAAVARTERVVSRLSWSQHSDRLRQARHDGIQSQWPRAVRLRPAGRNAIVRTGDRRFYFTLRRAGGSGRAMEVPDE